MRRRSALSWYVALVCLGALAALVLAAWRSGVTRAETDGAAVVLLGLATALSGLLPGSSPTRGRFDSPLPTATTLAFALMVLSPVTAVLALLVALSLHAAMGRASVQLGLFAASSSLGLLVGRAIFVLSTGEQYAASQLLPSYLPAVLAAGLTFFAVTVVLTAPIALPALPLRSWVPRASVVRPSPLVAWAVPLVAAVVPWLADILLAPLIIVALTFSPWLLAPVILLTVALHQHVPLRGRAEHEALHDAATGLPNRALFHLRFQSASRDEVPLAVMLVECYETGDAPALPPSADVPLLIAERLRQTLRKGDNLARLDAMTFGLIARLDASAPQREAERLAQRIVSGVQDISVSTGVSARLGMSLAPLHGTSAEVLMSRAETALELAGEGNAQWKIYDAFAREVSPERQSLLDELRDGLEADQLELRYQPKLDLRTNVVIGVEALARWRHPRRGLLGPAEFIPLAESGGLIAPLTLPLLDKALAQTAQWLQRGWRLNVAVNLSATHLADLRLPSQVAEALRTHGVPGELLTLEVTESTIMSDPGRAIRVLQELRTQGVRTSIDDYGTGYSSLAFLRQLQVDELKIDASFIRHLASADADELIVASTIDLAHNLGLRVVAEGVEDLDAWRRLTSLQCDVVQGYLLSPPQRGEELTEWLGARRVAGVPRHPSTNPVTYPEVAL